jgi:signal transduction histidine kinase
MSSQAPKNTQSAALRRSEAYLAETQRLTRTGSFAIEGTMQAVIYSSAEHSRLYGFDPAHGLPSIADFFARIHPDDRAMCVEVMSRGVRELTDVEVEYRVLVPGSPPRIIHAFGHPVPGGAGESVEIVGTIVDVTERREAEAQTARVAEEQAALRRVATLVARGAAPEEVFAAVTEEVGRLFLADLASMCRYESDGTFTIVATAGTPFPVGSRWPLGGKNLATLLFETGRPARMESYADASGAVADDIRERGIRSAVGTPINVEDRLWGGAVVAMSREQVLPPDTETRLASFTELAATAISNAQARTEVAASRARIVAATDEERRRLVRDLHDGAQQRLVHTVITLKMAQSAAQNGEQDVPALLSEALDNAKQATVELRELAHGILPAVLTREGLRAGVGMLASRMPVPVEIDMSVDRLPAAVEATAYFVVAEALTNVAKHARAHRAEVTVRIEDGTLAVHVRDDGAGGARHSGGSGLIGLADRLAAVDGELRVESPADGGTFVAAAIPLPRP